MTCYVSPLHSQVKGESHASVCGSRSHALIPTGARSTPAALPKPILISVPRPHCWKGSASKPYVELPPHTAPLGMEVGPAQACAVKVVVHERRRVEVKAPFTIGAAVDSIIDGKRSPYEYGVNAASRDSLFLSEEKLPYCVLNRRS